jgi:hypothetical protein
VGKALTRRFDPAANSRAFAHHSSHLAGAQDSGQRRASQNDI